MGRSPPDPISLVFGPVFGEVRQPALVADGVVQLGTDLVNWFLVDVAGRVVVVDTGLPGYRPQFEPGLALLGRGPKDVEAILLTHSHSDHTGSAEALRRELDVPVYVHEAETEATRTSAVVGKSGGSQLPYLRYPHAWRLLAHFRTAGTPEPVRELVPFADGNELPGGLRAIKTEGHTPGHCVFHAPERGLLFAGDHLCTTNPLTGRNGVEILPRPLNVSSEAMLASLDRIEPLEAHVVLFGHGDPYDGDTRSAVGRARDAGIT